MTAAAGEVCVFGHGQVRNGQPAQLPAAAHGQTGRQELFTQLSHVGDYHAS